MGGVPSKPSEPSKTKPNAPPKKKEEIIIVGDRNGERKVGYGNEGVPVSLFSGEMPQQLMEELHKLDIFSCPEQELEEKGFYKCVDYPQLPTHLYYEGYFHSCRTSNPIKSINPRQGSTLDKPAAPPLLRAMCIAFREKNKEWLCGISQELKELGPPKGEEEREARAAFEKALDPENEQVLGDLAIQVHYGHPVEEPNIGYHTDSLNSALHFAFALRGDRKLHSYRSETREEARKRKFDHHVDPQKGGDVYISSPAFFRHGVEYPETTWENRIVAIQARFLFTRSEIEKGFKLRLEGEDRLGEVITKALVSGPVLPSYEEVVAVCGSLEDV